MIHLDDNVAKYVSLISRQMQVFFAKRMESLDIGPGQYAYLFALYGEDGQSQQSLSNQLLVDKSATVKAINKLEELGYVERKTNPKDKRYYYVYLTPKGLAIKPDLEAIVEEIYELMFLGISEDEREDLLNLMRRVARNIIIPAHNLP